MTEQCGICIEDYTKTVRKKITCPSCQYEACLTCTKQYIINETSKDAHCMNCKVAYTNDFLIDNFTKKWNNEEYRNHRTNLLINEQKSHLPDTEGYVRNLIDADKLYVKSDKISKQINSIFDECTKRKKIHYDRIRELEIMIREENDKIRVINNDNSKVVRPLFKERRGLEDEAYELVNGRKTKKEKREFLMKCCKNDCKGFVNNKYKCGICEIQMCSKCYKEKTDDHECNEDDVKTIEEIKKTCKNCPKCGIPTQKISGCPQMWCVECHAVWSWNTGEIDNSGRVHNPHYFQFLRNGDSNNIRREAGDVLCGGDVTGLEMREAMKQSQILDTTERKAMLDIAYIIIEQVNHISGYELPKYREAPETVLRDMRVKYLRNQYSDEQWFNELKKFEKKERRKKEYRDVIGLFIASIQDLLRNSVDTRILQLKEIMEMKDYANNVFVKLNKQYNIKGYYIPYIELSSIPIRCKLADRLNITQV